MTDSWTSKSKHICLDPFKDEEVVLLLRSSWIQVRIYGLVNMNMGIVSFRVESLFHY